MLNRVFRLILCTICNNDRLLSGPRFMRTRLQLARVAAVMFLRLKLLRRGRKVSKRCPGLLKKIYCHSAGLVIIQMARDSGRIVLRGRLKHLEMLKSAPLISTGLMNT